MSYRNNLGRKTCINLTELLGQFWKLTSGYHCWQSFWIWWIHMQPPGDESLSGIQIASRSLVEHCYYRQKFSQSKLLNWIHHVVCVLCHLYFQLLNWIGKLTSCKVNTSCSVQLFLSILFLSEKSYYWWFLVPNVDSLWNRLFLLIAPLLIFLMLLGYHLCAAHCHLKLKLKIFKSLLLGRPAVTQKPMLFSSEQNISLSYCQWQMTRPNTYKPQFLEIISNKIIFWSENLNI